MTKEKRTTKNPRTTIVSKLLSSVLKYSKKAKKEAELAAKKAEEEARRAARNAEQARLRAQQETKRHQDFIDHNAKLQERMGWRKP